MSAKKCKGCGEVKPFGLFFKCKSSADGLQGKCKECFRIRMAKWREDNRALANEHAKRYTRKPEKKALIRAYRKKYSLANPWRDSAKRAVSHALASGKMERLPCWICGGSAEAHHPDYSMPLDVVWLCNQHHRQLHREARKYTETIK